MAEEGSHNASDQAAAGAAARVTAPAAVPVSQPPAVPPVVSSRNEGARRSRAWMWWTVGIVAALALLVGSCTLPAVFLLRDSAPSGGADWGFSDAVAVIHVDGIIAGTGSSLDGYITPEYMDDQLTRAEEDDDVKAIVLRVDSPGGTVAASEEIALFVEECTKPVIVSIGDVGASGAYMISCNADEIWALPGSAVGSIGVISTIPNAKGLLEKVGVDFQVITAGKYKDAGSPYRALTPDERRIIQGEVDEAYEQFIGIVAKGRTLDRSKVESMATGLTWSGEKAKSMGLVDEIGTFRDALDAAADAGGIAGDYDVITYDDEFQDLFGSLIGLQSGVKNLGAVLGGSAQSSGRAALPR